MNSNFGPNFAIVDFKQLTTQIENMLPPQWTWCMAIYNKETQEAYLNSKGNPDVMATLLSGLLVNGVAGQVYPQLVHRSLLNYAGAALGVTPPPMQEVTNEER